MTGKPFVWAASIAFIAAGVVISVNPRAAICLADETAAATTQPENPSRPALPTVADDAPAPDAESASAPTTQNSAQQNTPATQSTATTRPVLKTDLLGPKFTSEEYGLSFNPPLDCTQIHTPNAIIQFEQPKDLWQIKVTRVVLEKGLPLTRHNDQFGHPENGVMEVTINNIHQNTPDAQIINAATGGQVIDVGNTRVGMIFVRFANAEQKSRLLEEAIVAAPNTGNRLYYFIDFISPGKPLNADANTVDPQERKAYETFSQMVDTIQVLDLTKLVNDQTQRLINTRSLFVTWNSDHYKLIKSALIPSRYDRIIKNGKDIGYTYSEERAVQNATKPDPNGALVQQNPDDLTLQVTSRTRLMISKDVQWDTLYWMRCSINRKHETWTNFAKSSNMHGQTMSNLYEVATSDELTKAISIDHPQQGGPEIMNRQPGDTGPLGAGPGVDVRTVRTLNVHTRLNKSLLDPFEQDVPVFYIPQAISAILPRILPLDIPKKYMFAVFVATPDAEVGRGSGAGKVMARYIDVLPLQQVTLNGVTFDAVPVKDHIGIAGPVTTYYLSSQGKFLGSISTYTEGDDKKVTMAIVPSDENTLERLWDHPQFTIPQEAGSFPDANAPANKDPQLPSNP